MLSNAVKRRIARNRKLRATPKWVQKAELFVHNEKTKRSMRGSDLSMEVVLILNRQVEQQPENRGERVPLEVWLSALTRVQWYELERLLPIEARWTPLQMKATVRATGGYRAVIAAHGGYRGKLSARPVYPKGMAPAMGNWDNPAKIGAQGNWVAEDNGWMTDGNQWEAEHGDDRS